MTNHLVKMEIVGSSTGETGLPVELDMFVYDEQDTCYGLNVMTLKQYEEAVLDMPNGQEEPGAPHVFVLNEDNIVLDSLAELLKGPDKSVFDPYLIPLEEAS